MFETRSHAWQEVGLERQISPRVAQRARAEALALVFAFAGVVVLYNHRVDLLGAASSHGKASTELPSELDAPVRAVTVVVLMILGWGLLLAYGVAVGSGRSASAQE